MRKVLSLAILLLFCFSLPTLAQKKVKVKTGAHSVTLTWGASTVGANCAAPASISYTVLRGPSAGSEISLATGIVPLTYVDSSVSPGSTYFYIVEGVELCGATSIASAPSNEISATILNPPSPPTPPVNVTGSAQ